MLELGGVGRPGPRSPLPTQQSAERCVSTLLDLLRPKVNYVVQGGHRGHQGHLRKYPSKCVATAPCLSGAAVLGPGGAEEHGGALPLSSSSLLLCAPGLNRNHGGKDKAHILFPTSLFGSCKVAARVSEAPSALTCRRTLLSRSMRRVATLCENLDSPG